MVGFAEGWAHQLCSIYIVCLYSNNGSLTIKKTPYDQFYDNKYDNELF